MQHQFIFSVIPKKYNVNVLFLFNFILSPFLYFFFCLLGLSSFFFLFFLFFSLFLSFLFSCSFYFSLLCLFHPTDYQREFIRWVFHPSTCQLTGQVWSFASFSGIVALVLIIIANKHYHSIVYFFVR